MWWVTVVTIALLAGLLGYFWNAGETFDFVIVVASLAALISGKYPNLNMARVFRSALFPCEMAFPQSL